MKEKILYLERRGCNFFSDEEITKKSDIGNYRVTCNDIQGKDNRIYFLEFTCGKRWNIRKTDKRNGRPLLHPVMDLVNAYALHLDSCSTLDGKTIGNRKLDQYVWNIALDYSQKNILKVVNFISKDHFTAIHFIG